MPYYEEWGPILAAALEFHVGRGRDFVHLYKEFPAWLQVPTKNSKMPALSGAFSES